MERSDVVLHIMEQEDITYGKANKHLNSLVSNVQAIVCFYKYYEWAIDENKLWDIKVNKQRIQDILEGMPFYKKDPVLDVCAEHIVALSKRSLFREFCRGKSVNLKLEQVLFCSSKDIVRLNNILNKQRGKYDLNIHTH